MKLKFIVAVLMLAVAGSFLPGCPGSGGGASPASGSLIWAQTNNPSTSHDGAHAIAIDANFMYIVGVDRIPGSTDPIDDQWHIEKRNLSDGSLVGTFGSGGVVTNNPSASNDEPYAIAIDANFMYIVGVDRSPGSTDSQWRIEKRSLADGSLVTTFGSNGVATSNPSSSYDGAFAIAIDASSLYVVGRDYSPGSTDSQWRIEKRSLADGSLVDTFGSGGVVTNNPSTGYDLAYKLAIESNFLYTVGYDSSPGSSDTQWRIEKRSLADGSLVDTFGSGGVVTNNPSANDDGAPAIAVDTNFMYIVGSDRSPGTADTQWRIEKRSIVDGSLVTTFGSGGVVTNDYGIGYDWLTDIAIDANFMYIVGSDRSPGSADSQWRIEKRLK